MANLGLILLLSIGAVSPSFSEIEINTYWSEVGEWKTKLIVRDEEQKIIDWAWFTEDYRVQKIPGQQRYLVFYKGKNVCWTKTKKVTRTNFDPERECAKIHGMTHRKRIFR